MEEVTPQYWKTGLSMKDDLKVNENKIMLEAHGHMNLNFLGYVHSAPACLLSNS